MRVLLAALLFCLHCVVSLAIADDAERLEIKLRETPQALYDQVSADFPTNLRVTSREELVQQAKTLGITPDDLLANMALLARLTLEIQVKANPSMPDAAAFIAQLQPLMQTPLEQASLLNLQGRFLGRTTQDYTATIELNNQALTRISDDNSQAALLLKFVIYDDLGVVNLMTKKNQAALNNMTQLRETAYRLRNDYLLAEAETKLGKYFRQQQQLNQALQHYTEAYRLAAKANYPYQKAQLQLNLAKLYRDLEQWDDALNYVQQAVDSFKKLGVDAYVSSGMTVIAMIYAAQEQWNKAIDYYLNAQQIDARLKNFTAQGLNFHNLGEAYFKLGNTQNALDYLLQANHIFKERNSSHYLVYNELLIAQVAVAANSWQLAQQHAQLAEQLSNQLSLVAEQVEALGYQLQAMQAQQNSAAIIALQQRIIALNQQQLTAKTSKQQDTSSAELNEQKLALKVDQLQQQFRQRQSMVEVREYAIAVSLLLLLIAASYLLRQRQQLHKAAQQLSQLHEKADTDPLTELPGFRPFCRRAQADVAALALLAFSPLLRVNLSHGHHSAVRQQQQLFRQLQALGLGEVFSISHGIFALALKQPLPVTELQQKMSNFQLKQQPIKADIGYIALPLLADTEIQLPAGILYETLQFALSGARSVGEDGGNYVALKALDFTPSSVFSQPLFLQLEKSIERGFVRVESNVNKAAILWPKSNEPLISENLSII